MADRSPTGWSPQFKHLGDGDRSAVETARRYTGIRPIVTGEGEITLGIYAVTMLNTTIRIFLAVHLDTKPGYEGA